MRTSLIELKRAEDFLAGRLSPSDAVLFRAKMILDRQLRENVNALNASYAMVKAYGRRKLKAEIASVENNIFTDPSKTEFQQKIAQLFSNP